MIAKKGNFIMIICPPRKSPYKYADELINDCDPRVDNKWGPCGCIEFSKPQLQKVREKYPHLKGKKGIRAHLFFGWASS